MNRCMSCMSAIPKDNVCRHCGFDNNNIEPKKMRHIMPGTVLRNRFIIGLSTKSNNIFITYIAYDREKKKKIYIDEFAPTNITKRALGKLKLNVRDEFNAKFERAKRLIVKQTKTLLALKSKNIDILGAFSANNTFYIIREFNQDKTLSEYMKEHNDIPQSYAKHIIRSIIKILIPIHKEGLINGNISPDNIVIDAIDSVKLTNFGYAALSEILPVPVNEGYSPVEQYKKGEKLTQRIDVYSVAAIYYFMLTGEKPVSATTRQKTDTLTPPSTVGIEIERYRENALLNALNINPKNRTSTLIAFTKESKDKGTVRHWERVKAAPKKDYSFVAKKDFWKKLFITLILVVVAGCLVGLIYETVSLENDANTKRIKESEISTMAIPTEPTTDIDKITKHKN